MVHGKGGVDRPVTPPLAKVMPKTRFFGLRWVFFWPVLGAGWPHDHVVRLKTRKIPQNLKMQKKMCKESFDPIFLQASQEP